MKVKRRTGIFLIILYFICLIKLFFKLPDFNVNDDALLVVKEKIQGVFNEVHGGDELLNFLRSKR